MNGWGNKGGVNALQQDQAPARSVLPVGGIVSQEVGVLDIQKGLPKELRKRRRSLPQVGPYHIWKMLKRGKGWSLL